MELSELRNLIREALVSLQGSPITLDYLYQRVPFLKEFTPVNYKDRDDIIHLTKSEYNSDKDYFSPDGQKVNFKHVNLFSVFTYYIDERNGEKYHNFSLENDVVLVLGDNPQWDAAVKSVAGSMSGMIAKRHAEDLSFKKEIKQVENELPANELDSVMNEINRSLFGFGAYVEKSYHSEFLKV